MPFDAIQKSDITPQTTAESRLHDQAIDAFVQKSAGVPVPHVQNSDGQYPSFTDSSGHTLTLKGRHWSLTDDTGVEILNDNSSYGQTKDGTEFKPLIDEWTNKPLDHR